MSDFELVNGEMASQKVQHVVADAGAFIRNAPLQSIGEKIYTLPDVVSEIKDKATKQRLQVLPYQIIYRQPSSEALHYVSEFAKKTGDYRSLSAVDIKVMALTFQLEKETVGTDHLKSVPDNKAEWNVTTKLLEKPTDIAGFYLQTNKSSSRTTSECTTVSASDSQELTENEKKSATSSDLSHDINYQDDRTIEQSHDISNQGDSTSEQSHDSKANIIDENDIKSEQEISDKIIVEVKDSGDSEIENLTVKNESESKTVDIENTVSNISQNRLEGHVLPTNVLEEESESDDESCEEEDDDEEGWITPSNIKDVKEKMGDINTEIANVPVGCLTTDFAIQNVLIQMGLNVISVDGMLIKKAKSYVLRCFACMK